MVVWTGAAVVAGIRQCGTGPLCRTDNAVAAVTSSMPN
ncbi:hypothetical protein L842_1925 [Mycobacterium intracellulare MIN_052511_1280]|nr:hypothetical protein L842_1925 [Mycobacterium intracellulare MIN_052511_1280]